MVPELLKGVAHIAALESAEPGAILGGKFDRGETTLEIDAGRILPVCRYLHEAERFDRLADLTAVDWLPRDPRFDIIYHLHSTTRHLRLRLKCRVPDGAAEIDSVSSVWGSADWHEREVFDLFGVAFRGHPNLRRIMMPDDWEGHPLRKDYPVFGQKYGYKDR
ncbi:MAG: NADH-quinone oxidoreductase subunit C [Bryobacterales bacterium]|nr:NADH-quinone oxidoreductase subunit C [Bryobacterales bacterium]